MAADGTASSDRDCKLCELGTYTLTDNEPRCTSWSACEPGTYILQEGSRQRNRQCEVCQEGKYTSAYNATTCTSRGVCERGSYVSFNGTTSSNRECTNCADGKFTDSVDAYSCQPFLDCPIGTSISRNGTSVIDRACSPCEDGFTDTTNAFFCTPFTQCEAGTYVTAHPTATTDRTCNTCGSNHYNLGTNVESCMECDACEDGFTETVACTPTTNRVCSDLTKPEIIVTATHGSLVGNILTLEVNSEPGALAATAEDTSGSAFISSAVYTPSPTISTAQLGDSQSVTFTASDGNPDNTVTRTITILVVDTQPPVIVPSVQPQGFVFEAAIEVDVEAAILANFTATDNVALASGATLISNAAATVSLFALGTVRVVVRLNGTDTSGNEAAPITVDVTIVDTTPPVLGGELDDFAHEAATQFFYPSITAYDTLEGNLDSRVVRTGDVDIMSPDGTVIALLYNVTDNSGNWASETVFVTILDTTPPDLDVIDEDGTVLEYGSKYNDAGATATDALDGTVRVNATYTEPTACPFSASVREHTFKVTYIAFDAAGNNATATRIVIVQDTTRPVFTTVDAIFPVEATNPIDVSDVPTLVATDNCNTPVVTVDTSDCERAPSDVAFVCELVYHAEDALGNDATASRFVKVSDTTPPTIRPIGADSFFDVVTEDNDRENAYAFLEMSAQDIIDADPSWSVSTKAVVPQQYVSPTCQPSWVELFAVDDLPLYKQRVVDVRAPNGTVYETVYYARDRFGNNVTATRTITVIDGAKPYYDSPPTREDVLEFAPGAAGGVKLHDVVVRDRHLNKVLLCGKVEVYAPRDADATTGTYQTAGRTRLDESYAMDALPANATLDTLYLIRFVAYDLSGQSRPLNLFRLVADTTPPALSLSYGNVTVPYGTTFSPVVATALDQHDGNLTSAVQVDAPEVNVRVPGTYTFVVSVGDSSGNVAEEHVDVVVDALEFPGYDFLVSAALKLNASAAMKQFEALEAELQQVAGDAVFLFGFQIVSTFDRITYFEAVSSDARRAVSSNIEPEDYALDASIVVGGRRKESPFEWIGNAELLELLELGVAEGRKGSSLKNDAFGNAADLSPSPSNTGPGVYIGLGAVVGVLVLSAAGYYGHRRIVYKRGATAASSIAPASFFTTETFQENPAFTEASGYINVDTDDEEGTAALNPTQHPFEVPVPTPSKQEDQSEREYMVPGAVTSHTGTIVPPRGQASMQQRLSDPGADERTYLTPETVPLASPKSQTATRDEGGYAIPTLAEHDREYLEPAHAPVSAEPAYRTVDDVRDLFAGAKSERFEPDYDVPV
eukprot:m.314488 g.314488  ORF g.314488 m.314488 type:complete len:1304 (+) comp15970_c0_seq21:1061-4972(+)